MIYKLIICLLRILDQNRKQLQVSPRQLTIEWCRPAFYTYKYRLISQYKNITPDSEISIYLILYYLGDLVSIISLVWL
jgi:hypothetical protein